jgi:eukaryotic-like serine/threonine-protein kinase
MSDLTGQILSYYEFQEKIGHGRNSTVYRAIQRHIGRTVAVKILPAHFLQDDTFLERFNRELRVIAGFEHPYIVPVRDFGELNGFPFIVMRYFNTGTLADLVQQQGTLSLDVTVRLVSNIATALDYAHSRGIIHRDLKPHNVFVDKHGEPFLADFSITKIMETTLQLTGGLAGTPVYMAPELAEPGTATPLSDIYALGVMLYQMLSGRAPFEADTPTGILAAHVTEPIPDVLVYRPDLPDAVRAVIERAMAKNPRDRYQSAGELATALRQAADHNRQT